LLAKACGAQVRRATAKEIGWRKIVLTEDGKKDDLFRGCPGHLTVFEWHEDTFDMPEGGVLLGTGRTRVNQAFRIGQNAYGLQFHLEITPPMIENWAEDEAEKSKMLKILAETTRMYEAFREQAMCLLSNFQRIIEAALQIKGVIKMFAEEERKAKKKKSALWWSSKGGTRAR
jgi:GMP synthase (glutamine-hydrolysing)